MTDTFDTFDDFLREMDEVTKLVSRDNPDVEREYDRVDRAVERLGQIAQRRRQPA